MVVWCGLLSFSARAQTLSYHLAKADSLFHQKRYTQSMDLYRSIFEKNQFTPSMLLKMAYIEEGLDHVAQAMYYLNLYYHVTKDDRAAAKISEMATKHNLLGYEFSDTERVLSFYADHSREITIALASCAVLVFSLMIYQRRRKVRPVGSALLLLVIGAVLALHTNYRMNQRSAIVALPNTYIMSGPSAGSSVVRILSDGHKLEITGEHDVWFRVQWDGKEVYVKKDHLLPIVL